MSVISVLFTKFALIVIYLVRVWSRISRTSKDEVLTAESVVNTAMPNLLQAANTGIE